MLNLFLSDIGTMIYHGREQPDTHRSRIAIRDAVPRYTHNIQQHHTVPRLAFITA